MCVFSLKALEVPGVKVLRFESSLYFGNVERFRNALVMVSGRDPGTQQEPRKEVKFTRKDVSESDKLLKNRKGVGYNSNGKTPNGVRTFLERSTKRFQPKTVNSLVNRIPN